MANRGPSTKSLVAFEAVARHQSISRASAEMSISQSATSARLKNLESHLGIQLFVRDTGPLRLSRAGSKYLHTIREIFSQLAHAAEWAESLTAPIHLTVFGAFAQYWLMPRYERLLNELHGVPISLVVSEDAKWSAQETVLAIQLAYRPSPGMTELLQDSLVAVCHPDIQSRVRFSLVQDLLRVKVFYEGDHSSLNDGTADAALWLRKLGLDPGAVPEIIGFKNSSLLVEAALNGIGLALVPHSLVAEEIERGRLVVPFNHMVSCSKAIYFTSSQRGGHNLDLQRMRAWLIKEAAATVAAKESVALKIISRVESRVEK